MSLHDRIKRLEWISEPCNREALLERKSDYADGLCDGANGAAKIAKDADMVMHRLALALEEAVEWNWMDDIEPVPETVTKQINDAMKAYNDLLMEGRK